MTKLLYQYPLLRKAYNLATFYSRRKEKEIKLQQQIVLDNLSDLIHEDPLLNIEEFNGYFYFNVKSHLFRRYVLYKKYEPELVKICKQYIKKNHDAIDIGANIGLFTIFLAKHIGKNRVLSVEPTKGALKRLYKNIHINQVSDRVTVYEGVVSDKIGQLKIKEIVGKDEYSSLGNSMHPSVRNEVHKHNWVNSTTLDKLILQLGLNPGFIKIDVEGCEYLVINGMKQTFEKYRPIVLSELSNYLLKRNGSSAKEIIEAIKSFDYTVIDPITQDLQPGIKDFGDILCIPNEIAKNQTTFSLATQL